MGTAYSARQSSYTQGDTIDASDSNDEFDAILAAFGTSGHSHDGTAGEGGAIAKLLSNTLTFGAATSGTDITITFDGETNDGVLAWMEDEDYFKFSDDILVNSTEKIMFGDTASFIHQSSDGVLTIDGEATIDLNASTAVLVSNDLKLNSDAAVLGFGADNDVTLTHVADTGVLLNSTMAIQFNDASQYINAPSATVLDINATDEIELNATLVDVNANLDVSGTYTGGGLMTTGGNIVIPNAGNIGSASDTDAISISSGGVVTMNQIPVFSAGINVSGGTIAGTLATAAQGNVTSLGTLTTLTVDNIIINGTTIGHTSDTDAMTISSGGVVTFSQTPIFSGDLTIEDDLYLDSDSAVIHFGEDGDITLTHAADTGLTTNGTFQATTITATTAVVPDASDGAALGTTSLEWSDLYLADGAVIGFGDDQDVTLTHVADTGLLLSSTDQLQFGDSGTYIHQSADGVLDLVSDTEIEINATTIDINGAVDVSGAYTGGGLMTTGGNIVIPNAGNIGSASDTDAIAIASDGKVTFSQAMIVQNQVIATSLDISGDIDIDGTTNLDAVDIDGAVQADGTITVGVDDTGYDVKFFGATSGKYMLWDESADSLIVVGNVSATSLLATDIKFGEDNETKIDFGTANQINFYTDNTVNLTLSGASGSELATFGKDLTIGDTNDGSELKILASDAAYSAIRLGSATDANAVLIQTSHNQNKLEIITQNVGHYIVLAADNNVTNLTLSGSSGAQAATFSGDVKLAHDGAVLYFGSDSEINLEHVADHGLKTNGHINILDNKRLYVGTGNDLQIFHDGSNSYVHDSGTGQLYLAASALHVTNNDATESMIYAAENGAVSLYHDNAVKIATTATGVSVTGDVSVSDDINMVSDGAIITFGANSEVTLTHVHDTGLSLSGEMAISSHIDIPDNAKIKIGTGDDLEIYHDGSNSFINDVGTGVLAIQSDGIGVHIQNTNGEALGLFKIDGAVELYYDNSKKLETVSTGVTVTGGIVSSDNIHMRHDGAILHFGVNDDVIATHVHDVGLDFSSTRSGADSIFRFKNSANASASDVRLIIQNGGTSGGDPLINFDGQATNATWSVGVDTSATKFVIADADKGGFDGSDEVFTIATGGAATFGASVVAKTDTDTSNTGSVTLDFTVNQNFVLTLTGNVTLANPTTERVGASGVIVCIQDGTGSRTLSLGSQYKTSGDAGITLSTGANDVDIIPYFVQAADNILLGAVQKDFVGA